VPEHPTLRKRVRVITIVVGISPPFNRANRDDGVCVQLGVRCKVVCPANVKLAPSFKPRKLPWPWNCNWVAMFKHLQIVQTALCGCDTLDMIHVDALLDIWNVIELLHIILHVGVLMNESATAKGNRNAT
jgi:hypothetical protein